MVVKPGSGKPKPVVKAPAAGKNIEGNSVKMPLTLNIYLEI